MSMKKLFAILALGLLLVSCTANVSNKQETSVTEDTVLVINPDTVAVADTVAVDSTAIQ